MSLKSQLSRLTAQLQHLWMGRPGQVIYFGCGLGDDLLCTAVAREMKKRGIAKIVMFSKYASLFEQNADIAAVYNFNFATALRRRPWGYGATIPRYSENDHENDRDVFWKEHIITSMCREANLTGSVELRPYLYLTDAEKKAGQLFPSQVAIQSSGLAVGPGVMKNKNWFPERFQSVADAIGTPVKLVQLGQITDPPIQGALDLRGKTSLRESAAILAGSSVFIGLVGFLMHLARAVDTRSVIVYGGRETPTITGYDANENVVGVTPCSPCWLRNKCDFERECMRMILPDEVIAAVKRQLERVGTPLETGEAKIS
jgi:hypothetical protein